MHVTYAWRHILLHLQKRRRASLGPHHPEARRLNQEEQAGIPMVSYKTMAGQDREVVEYKRIAVGQCWILWIGEYKKCGTPTTQ